MSKFYHIMISKSFADGSYPLKELLSQKKASVQVLEGYASFEAEKPTDDFILLLLEPNLVLTRANSSVWTPCGNEMEQIHTIYENQRLQKIYVSSEGNGYVDYPLYKYYPDMIQAEQAMKQYITLMMNKFLEALREQYRHEKIYRVFVDIAIEMATGFFFSAVPEKRKVDDELKAYAEDVIVSAKKEEAQFFCALNVFLENKCIFQNMKKFLDFLPFVREYLNQHIREYVSISDDFKSYVYPSSDSETICGVDENGTFQYLFHFN